MSASDPSLAMIDERGERWSHGALAERAREELAVGASPERSVFDGAPSASAVVRAVALLTRGAPLVPLHPRWTELERAGLTSATQPLRLEAWTVAHREPEQVAAALRTSGTAGAPRVALLSRRALDASARLTARALGLTERDRWLLAMPLAHVGGLSVLTRALHTRSAVLLQPRFDPDATLEALARGELTGLSVVPTMLYALLERDRRNLLARARCVLVGGAALPLGLAREAHARGLALRATYGLTEACSQVTLQRGALEPGQRHAGEPLDELRLAVRDERGAALPAGGEGQLFVAGPTLFSGYLGEAARAPDEPFATGDLGRLDARGRLEVLARRTDLLVSGGENVYPSEVERALEALPGVARAAVFGVPDERWGQRVAAVLVVREPERFALAGLRAGLRAALAAHKHPRLAALVRDDELPLNAAGKLDRRALGERFAARLVALPASAEG